ncbi:MAG: hypothetical protein DRJ34_04705 [Thermoprotei archaeon]|nr:MAG: hypothetical protein DRJ34_04705 [Thermoprotei archaeon]
MDKIQHALNLYSKAKSSKNKIYVTSIARSLASPISHHLKDFKYKHYLWGDIDKIYLYNDIFTPFPLAWKYENIWIYGWSDLIHFKNQIPIEVYEVKQYADYKRYDEVQLQLYGLLCYKIFHTKPRLFLAQQVKIKFKNIREVEFDENIEKNVVNLLSNI